MSCCDDGGLTSDFLTMSGCPGLSGRNDNVQDESQVSGFFRLIEFSTAKLFLKSSPHNSASTLKLSCTNPFILPADCITLDHNPEQTWNQNLKDNLFIAAPKFVS